MKYGVDSKNLLIGTNTEGKICITDTNGVVLSFNQQASLFYNFIKGKVEDAGYTVESVGDKHMVVEMGEQIPNWDSYTTI